MRVCKELIEEEGTKWKKSKEEREKERQKEIEKHERLMRAKAGKEKH